MVFSSTIFLFLFLPAFLIAYYLCPAKWRNEVALVASYIFYAWGAPRFAYVLFFSTIIDYVLGRYIYKSKTKRKKKQGLALALVLNVGLLAYVKYANFFVTEANRFLSLFGLDAIHWTHIALPIGVSFFTFQKISYLVDVYRGTVAPAKNFRQFALYVVLFPQLIAGPIVRYHDIAKQLVKRAYTSAGFLEGMYRFSIGMGKKVLIANPMGKTADMVFGLSALDLTNGYAWLGAIAYAMQIYFDFSGYSDMAIGLGKMMGFDFLENFNRPYISRTFTEFWRRWHISLSNWMKEYLYIPLGGNRVAKGRMFFNLWVVFLISGFWHGAAWTFILWGAYHGMFLVIDKIGWYRIAEKLPRLFTIPLTFIFVLFGWVLFRSETATQAFSFLGRMLDFQSPIVSNVLLVELINNRGWVALGIAIFISFVPALSFVKQSIAWMKKHQTRWYINIGQMGAIVVLLFLSAMQLANAQFNPFIYFRF